MTDPKWWVGMELGLTIPFTIVANINLRLTYRAANGKTETDDSQHSRIHLGDILIQDLSGSNDLESFPKFNHSTEKF